MLYGDYLHDSVMLASIHFLAGGCMNCQYCFGNLCEFSMCTVFSYNLFSYLSLNMTAFRVIELYL